jgi:hypothetical protein
LHVSETRDTEISHLPLWRLHSLIYIHIWASHGLGFESVPEAVGVNWADVVVLEM